MTPASSILEKNLAALALIDAPLAQTLSQTPPAEVMWTQLPTGLWSAAVPHQTGTLQLCSKYDPQAEARQIIAAVDFAKYAGAVVLGVGVGYHVLELAQRAKLGPVLVVYEPDAALFRAVLEKIDHTAWLCKPNVFLLVGEVNRGALLGRIEGYSSVFTQGTILVNHPPTRTRRPEPVTQFSQWMTELLNHFRVHIATALVNSARTVENLTANLGHYAAGPNTNALHRATAGYPAVCVGAGPSLAKNVDLLRDPQIRQGIVLISTQTTLKPLIDRGIRPDYVTALDYHEISRRFYEGLPALEDVTLVAEAKGHASMLDSFPGPIRIVASSFLNKFLGPAAPSIVPIKQGSTVAHLSFYLAQHMGCDPIIFIGQDLGFSEGLYYCPGTAIHEVWAPELSPWNTLEMMEWQRIVRHRGLLHKRADIHGQTIYTDEQMTTYLNQFERDFSEAKETIIDATEGGLPKEHSTRMTLAQALALHARRPVPRPPLPARQLNPERLTHAVTQVQERRRDLQELRRLTRETIPLLREMCAHQKDPAKTARLYEKIQKRRQQVGEFRATFELVNDLNTVGVYKRARTDRAIEFAATQDPYEKQRLQLDRDIENLEWMLQAFDEAERIFTHALDRLERFRNP